MVFLTMKFIQFLSLRTLLKIQEWQYSILKIDKICQAYIGQSKSINSETRFMKQGGTNENLKTSIVMGYKELSLICNSCRKNRNKGYLEANYGIIRVKSN